MVGLGFRTSVLLFSLALAWVGHAGPTAPSACELALIQHPEDSDFREFLDRPEIRDFSRYLADPEQGARGLREMFESNKAGRSEYSPHEVEIDLSPALLDTLTTTDGTLAPLIALTAASDRPSGASADTRWETLPRPEKRAWLKALVSGRTPITFFQKGGRTIPGIKVGPTIRLEFLEATDFLGVRYEPGTVVELATDFLEAEVEVRSPLDYVDPQGPSGIELHLRATGGTPADLARWSWAFQRGLGVADPYSHAHRLARVYEGIFAGDSVQFHLRIAEFILRLNQYMELAVVARGEGLSESLSEAPVPGDKPSTLEWANFSPLHTEQFYRFAMTLFSAKPFDVNQPGARIKAFAGLTWPGFYRDGLLWGVELRTLEPRFSDIVLPVADRLPRLMEDPGFGLPYRFMADWANHFKIDQANTTNLEMTQHLAVLSFGSLVARIEVRGAVPAELVDKPGTIRLDGIDCTHKEFYEHNRQGRDVILTLTPETQELFARHRELGILFKAPSTWLFHPVVVHFGVDLPHLARVREAHVSELAQLIRSPRTATVFERDEEITALVSRYVRASGLLPAFARSLGLAP